MLLETAGGLLVARGRSCDRQPSAFRERLRIPSRRTAGPDVRVRLLH